MKRFLPLLLVVLVALVGCKKEAPAEPELRITSPTTITIGADGGSSVISFEVTNPVKATKPAATASAAWVAIDEVGDDLVALTIAENTLMESRTAEVTITYADLRQVVSINQSAAEPDVVIAAEGFSGSYYGTRFSEGQNYYFGLVEGFDADGYVAPNTRGYYIDCFSDTAANDQFSVPYGTYTLDLESTGQAGTLSAVGTYWFNIDANGQPLLDDCIFFEEATLVVGVEGISFEATDTFGTTHLVTYSGPTSCFDESAEPEPTHMTTFTDDFTADLSEAVMIAEYHHDFYCDWEANWLLYIQPEDGTGDYFTFDIVTDTLSMKRGFDDTYTGQLTFSAHNFVPGMMEMWGSWYYYVEDWKFPEGTPQAPLMGGTLEIIKNDDGTHTVNIDCTDDYTPEPNRITATWTGVVEIIDRSGRGDMSYTSQPTPPLRAAQNRTPATQRKALLSEASPRSVAWAERRQPLFVTKK